jgi:hypothetical protein
MVLQHINSPPLDIREAVSGIDEQVAAAIMKGLKTDPKERWPAIDPMLYQFREAQERLFPTKSEKTRLAARAKAEARAKAAKPFVPTPGITLADEGITLADEQPDLKPIGAGKASATTPGISLADEQPGLKPISPKKAAEPTPGITLADDQPEVPAPRKVRESRDTASDGNAKTDSKA